jgi:multicomponent Na+:H+ antiporter subunit E
VELMADKTSAGRMIDPRESEQPKTKTDRPAAWRIKWTVIVIEFLVLFGFWILLSGRYQTKYLVIGLCAAGIVTYLTHDLLYQNSKFSGENALTLSIILACSLRLILYVPWLVWAIIKANIQVALIIISPHMPIDPGFLQFKTRLRKKISLVTLANSITLTPGTITVDLKGDTFIVHAIVRGAASDLESGVMQNKAGSIFLDYKDPLPNCSWRHSCEEIEK